MRVTEEFFGEAPNLAVLDGETLTRDSHFPARDCLGARNRDLYAAANPVGLCITQPISGHPYLLSEGNGVEVFARTEDVANAQAYMSAATHRGPADPSLAGHRASRHA